MRLALLLVARHVAERPHVVQPVGELDDQDADVAGHRDDHLADGLRLGGGTVLDLVQLGDAVDEGRDVLAELAAQLVQRVGGVLDGVVQQRGADRLGVHAEFGEDRGHRERVGDVRVARLALLVLVPVRGHLVGTFHRPHVRLRVVRADGLDQRFEYRVHAGPPLCSEPRQAAANPGARRDGLRRRREPLTSLASRARGAPWFPGGRALGRWVRGFLRARRHLQVVGHAGCGPVTVTWSVSPRSCPLRWAESADSPIRAAPSAPAVAVVITSPATSAPRICQIISLLAVINPRVES